MLRHLFPLLKSTTLHTVPRHPPAKASATLAPAKSAVSRPPHCRVVTPTVLDGLDAPLPAPVEATSPPSAASSTEREPLTARHLWAFSRVLRAHRDARRTHGACVVGGASAIRRVWRQYGIAPTVVYVPETEPVVPAWCLEAALPALVVRCAPVQVKRFLLSAEYSDGFAAEFPCSPEARLPPVHTLLTAAAPSHGGDDGVGGAPPHAATAGAVSSMVVLVGLRIPSNVGMLIRAAVDLGFERVVLVNCTDPLHEKVLRASDGTAFSPKVTLHELHTTEEGGVDGTACVALLSAIAARHHLFPFLAVPSQEAEPAFSAARELHRFNRQCVRRAQKQVRGNSSVGEVGTTDAASARPMGPMVVLGSESQGLRALDGEWTVPYQLVSLPVPNSAVDSLNVGVAGAILLNLFRPGAAGHFEKLRDATGEVDDDEGDRGTKLAPNPAAPAVEGREPVRSGHHPVSASAPP